MADRIEQQLGNYRLVRVIGVGSFGEVYVGEHVYLSTLAAIKVLHLRLAAANQEAFLLEARTVAGLVHPHIVRILDYGVDEKTPFLVMDFARNGTLRQRYRRGTILPLTLVVSYIRQIASALQFAHDKKLIHRDIKPENLLLGENNEVLLSDFGTASIVQSTHLQNVGKLIGTIAYMAPEQINGEAYFASDQYALGVITYEWLTGVRPFSGSPAELASQQLFAVPPPLRQKNARISPEIEEVVMMSLAKDPRQRFEDILAFAYALEQASGVEVGLLSDSNIAKSREVPVISVPPRIESDGIHVTTPDQVTLTPPSSASEQSIPLSVSSISEAGITPETALPQQQLQSKPRLSRRTVVGGLIGITALVTVGGFTIAWEISQMPVVTYRGHLGPVYTAAWSPDARLLVSGGADNTAQVWEAATGNHLLTYKGHTQSVNSLMWSPINTWKIASASADKTVAIWNASNGELMLRYTGHTAFVRTVAWSPDEQWICSGGDDKTIQVWEASTSKKFLTYRGHSKLVWSAKWSPNGNYIASTSVDTTVQVWEAFTGKNLLIYTGHSNPVTVAVWSPDGRLIASGSEDTTVQIWEATTGKHISTYRGHISTVNCLSWSPDGSRIASGSGDATVQVWDVATRQLIHTYDDHSGAITETALWSPTGRNIASARSSGIVQVWNAP